MNKNQLSIASLQPLIELVKRFRVILFFTLFAAIYVYLLLTVNQLTSSSPTAADISNETATVKRLRVDEKAANSMLRLEEENIEIQALFDEARSNPFAE